MSSKKEQHKPSTPSKKIPQDLDDEIMGDLKDDNESLAEDLEFDKQNDSYELDVESTAPEYRHPDPYDSSAKDGEDMDSDWDEANLLVGDEYEKEGSFEEEMEESAIHISNKHIVELSDLDEKLAETPEDKRIDLDEEGYPKNDGEEMP